MPSPGEFSQKCVATEGKGSQVIQCIPSPPLRLGKGSMGSAFCASLRSECASGPNSQVQLERQSVLLLGAGDRRIPGAQHTGQSVLPLGELQLQ